MKIRNEVAEAIFDSDREDDEVGIDADFGSGFALLSGRLCPPVWAGELSCVDDCRTWPRMTQAVSIMIQSFLGIGRL